MYHFAKEDLVNLHMILNRNSIIFQKVGNPTKVGKMASLHTNIEGVHRCAIDLQNRMLGVHTKLCYMFRKCNHRNAPNLSHSLKKG